MIYRLFFHSLAVYCISGAPTKVIPSEHQQPSVIPIVSQSAEVELNGTFRFSYETGNGIKREEISYDKVQPKTASRGAKSEEEGENDDSGEIHVQQGSYSYTAPDGTIITLRYIADENGFRPIGNHLPRAPALVPSSPPSNDKSGRALKQKDTSKSGSSQLPNIQPLSEVVPDTVSILGSKPDLTKKSPTATSSSILQPKLDINDNKTQPGDKEIITTTSTNQPEIKVETSESEENLFHSKVVTENSEGQSSTISLLTDEKAETTTLQSDEIAKASNNLVYTGTEINQESESSTPAASEDNENEKMALSETTPALLDEKTTEKSYSETMVPTTEEPNFLNENISTTDNMTTNTISTNKDTTTEITTETMKEVTVEATTEEVSTSTSTA